MRRECKWCGREYMSPGPDYCGASCADAQAKHDESERVRLENPLERIADSLVSIEEHLRVIVRRGGNTGGVS